MFKCCSKCGLEKSLTDFHKGKGKYEHKPDCKACVKQASQSKLRVLQDSYSHQKRSCIKRGYEEPQYSKEQLVQWGMSNKEFHDLYDKWKEAGFPKALKPSIDRINDYKTYSLDNIQITTFYQNQQNYYQNTLSGKTTKKSLAVDQLNLDGQFIERFPSIQMAARALNIPPINIQRCCTGLPVTYSKQGVQFTRIQRSAGGFKWRYSILPNDNSEQK